MPCRSDYMEPTPSEHKATNEVNQALKKLADTLTYSNDVFREYILGDRTQPVLQHVNTSHYETLNKLEKRMRNLYVRADEGLYDHCMSLLINYNWLNSIVTRQTKLTPGDYKVIEIQQIDHREDDLKRLMRTFAANGDRQRLRKVLDADNTKPLEPQLGFSPDEF